ncbi:MAG: lipopolysaccharide biosynthesis protein [Verrucomicrobiota bacterium]
MSLREKATKSVFWTFLSRFGIQAIRFLLGVVLARILLPEEFGLVAMVSVFTLIASTVAEGGFGAAIIQRKNLTPIDCSTAFWFNLSASVAVVVLLWFLAPLIAGFYSEPALVWILRAVSGGLIIQAFSTCQRARLNRELRFQELFKLELPAIVGGGLVGVSMALSGSGAWALVGQMLATNLLAAIGLWFRSGWIPRFEFSRQSFREMFGFGVKNALERTVDVAVREAYVLVIGRIFNPLQVGLYQRANSFQQLMSLNMYGMVNQVMFPLLSSIQGDVARMRRGFQGVLQLTAMVSFPAFAGLAAVSEPLILSLIGPEWLPSVPYLRALCIAGALLPLQGLNLTVILSIGKSGLSLKLAIIKRIALALAIVLTYRHGVMAMIWGQVACALFSWIVNTWPNRRTIQLSPWSQLALMAPWLLASLIMGLSVFLATERVDWNPWLELVGGALLGAVIYVGIIRFARPRGFDSLIRSLPLDPRLVRVLNILLPSKNR